MMDAFYIFKLHIALMEKMDLMMLKMVELLTDVTFQDWLLSISFQWGLFFVCWFCERVKALLCTNFLGQRKGFKFSMLHSERLVLDSILTLRLHLDKLIVSFSKGVHHSEVHTILRKTQRKPASVNWKTEGKKPHIPWFGNTKFNQEVYLGSIIILGSLCNQQRRTGTSSMWFE